MISADAQRLRGKSNKPGSLVVLFLTSAPFSAAALHRLASVIQAIHPGVARLVSTLNLRLHGADIDPRARIGAGLLLQHPVGVVIGGGATLGSHCTIMGGVTLGRRHLSDSPDIRQYPTVGENVLLGAGSCLLGNIEIGHNSVVAAKSLVLTDVPPFSLALGSPATSRKL